MSRLGICGSWPARQRAAAVLMLVQGWAAEHTAQVLGVPPRRIPSLVPQTEGLADASTRWRTTTTDRRRTSSPRR
ncbi:hypothetical protein [Ornithinimicrobium sp. W1665]|uniref:hypothetical protein n=1 Tax=Ornithinimicrobium sp. W1665 TaxID=3416666 RepID=UPI003D6C5340